MKFRDYFRDHIVVIIINLLVLIMINILMGAFLVRAELMAAVSILYLIAVFQTILVDFIRKRTFYNDIRRNISELDQKYLVAETIRDPSFYEGRLINEIIGDMEKSMYEKVAETRRGSTDFKEYLEMWVHEVKLPIASLMLKVNNLRDSLYEENTTAESYQENDEENTSAENYQGNDEENYQENTLAAMNYPGNTEENAGADIREYSELSEIEAKLRRINDLTDQVLFYARSSNAEKDYLIKSHKLNRVVSSVLQKSRMDIEERGVRLEIKGLSYDVITDGKWLEFMLGQFLANSLRYTSGKEDPVISIYAEDKDDTVTLHFRDNGIGISRADIPRVWDKHFTGENGHSAHRDAMTEKNFSSTGMGLYIVKKLCDKLGHRIDVDSVQGEYADFMIIFGKNDIFRVAG